MHLEVMRDISSQGQKSLEIRREEVFALVKVRHLIDKRHSIMLRQPHQV